jgi:ubiquinone/menaquinone biosynthesis C-methylase UbiE
MGRRDGVQRFDRLAAKYDEAQLPTEQAFIAEVRARLLTNAHGEVLEIGIGTGASLSDYPDDCQLTGVDLSNAMLEVCRNKLTGTMRRINLVQAAAECLPFPDETFDTVTCSLTLCAQIGNRNSPLLEARRKTSAA